MAADSRSEAALIERCRAGDATAATELVGRYQRALLSVSGRIVGRWDAAEEIVQEAFMRVFQNLDRIDPRRGPSHWLFRTTINLSHDWLRHSARRELPAEADPAAQPLFAAGPEGPEHASARSEELGRLERALAQLSPKLREVIVLHFIEELSFEEIARIRGVPSSVLRVRALRARAKLKELVGSEGDL